MAYLVVAVEDQEWHTSTTKDCYYEANYQEQSADDMIVPCTAAFKSSLVAFDESHT
jgi:hypothetical protein